MALDGFFGKKFKLETSDNFDNYMKALGEFLICYKDVHKYHFCIKNRLLLRFV